MQLYPLTTYFCFLVLDIVEIWPSPRFVGNERTVDVTAGRNWSRFDSSAVISASEVKRARLGRTERASESRRV